MENRIKEQFSLFAARVSAKTLRANQVRLYFSALAYMLVQSLRRLGLKKTELAHAQAHKIRLQLLKIGAQIRLTVRRVWISLASGFPGKTSLRTLGPHSAVEHHGGYNNIAVE